MSSISSTSSLCSSSTTTPFRSIYAKDARGHDLSESYNRKYGTSSVEVPVSNITRLIYAKDARGVEISTYEVLDYETSKTAPIVGDDGLPRGPYDLGQRERSLSYWAELRTRATSNSAA